MTIDFPLREGQKCITRDGRMVTIGKNLGTGAVGVLSDTNAHPFYYVRVHDGQISNDMTRPGDVVAEQINTPQPVRTAHPHAALMAEYAKDAAECAEPWTRWEGCGDDGIYWYGFDTHPKWDVECQYRRKPRTISINGHEVPEPLRVEPELRSTYWLTGLLGPVAVSWDGGDSDQDRLQRGILHATREAAEAHARALLSFTEVK